MALQFKETSINLGEVKKDTPIHFTITGTSTYDKDLSITSRGSCGCTSLSTVVALPNQEFNITGTITGRSKMGIGSKYVYVKNKEGVETTIILNYSIV